MTRSFRISALAVAVLVVAAYVVGALLFAVPALLLLALFARGRFPGEAKVLARRRAVVVAGRRLAPRRLGSAGRAPHAIGPAGTALLAFRRAVRPPPALLAAV